MCGAGAGWWGDSHPDIHHQNDQSICEKIGPHSAQRFSHSQDRTPDKNVKEKDNNTSYGNNLFGLFTSTTTTRRCPLIDAPRCTPSHNMIWIRARKQVPRQVLYIPCCTFREPGKKQKQPRHMKPSQSQATQPQPQP